MSDQGTLDADETDASAAAEDTTNPTWWSAERWARYLPFVVWGSFLLRVAVVLWVSRAWFFTDDDWDYITRQGWDSILEPHAGHLNVIAAAWAYVVRGIVGLDYWPGFALLEAIVWPLVGLAAWYVWQRKNVDPRWTALGAIFLMWLGTAAWIQFGHAGQGIAAAATIVAIYYDDKPLRTRYFVPNLLLSLLAAFASSTAGLAVIFRAVWSLLYRKWNGVAAAGATAVIYLFARYTLARLGPGTVSAGIEGLKDPFTTVRVGLELVGVGMREVVPWPRSLAWLLGLLLIVAAVLVLRAARFSYFSTALVGSGAVYVVVALITRFLGKPLKLDRVLTGVWGGITAPRFASLFLTYLVVAMIPVIASQRVRSKALRWGVAGLMVVMLAFGTVQSFRMWDAIAQKSESPKAPWPAQLVEMRATGEPGYPSEKAKVHPALSNFLDLAAIDYVLEAGLEDSLLASDIYRLGGVPEIEEARVRGRLRINVQSRSKTYGGWRDLGAKINKKCIVVEGSRTFHPENDALFRLERIDGNEVSVRWVDEWGPGSVIISEQYWLVGRDAVGVEVAGRRPGAEPGKLIIKSDAVNMCFDAPRSGG